jgi:hypothetical protein
MSPTAQRVRHACSVLAAFVDLLRLMDENLTPIGPGDLAAAFVEISRVGEILQSRRRESADPELEEAFLCYRRLLEQLRERMPRLQARLLTERARLEAQRAHLEAASLWAESTRTTR